MQLIRNGIFNKKKVEKEKKEVKKCKKKGRKYLPCFFLCFYKFSEAFFY